MPEPGKPGVTLDAAALERALGTFVAEHPMGVVQAEDAMRDDLIGMRIYETPIVGIAAADDPLFAALRAPEAVHPEYRLPGEWLPGARSVVSFFLPFTQRVREANAADMNHYVDEWMHARIEGEAMMRLTRQQLCDLLSEGGYAAVAPPQDAAFTMLERFAPNWSERHTAYICGLGTFGMSKGLITRAGVAGRFGSVVTDRPLPVTERDYDDLYAYCTQCGLCAVNCPVNAIDPSRPMHQAKAHPPCEVFVNAASKLPPRGASGRSRYGCGKCQVAVPCETCNPTA